ncbi:SDR family NAD(P)-dependent oxidoreductase [Kitasatospora paracochleata]|uniref:Meso-butanediol dehydrogenase/(S,S)-butanediol dehydrogenase/diacetyl reductase n=1 Tax=Kitasatospora paracochleata TaxID=58354 RepID=A0ABT1IW79_9ACTN|nr:SDR family oxidoreductase [Kitasatospora paracochleata]MCP2309382.1 meso-butanediol dehydrogenase/(S,S)-butanediol dehydrogenase/diacetyl reductase [Kitasatospora paracochleata]
MTGASSGIGFEIARRIRDEGARVYAADFCPAAVPEGTSPLHMDTSIPGSVFGALARVVRETGRLDVLCNTVETPPIADPLRRSFEDWERSLADTVNSVFLGTRFAIPTMLAQQSGVIVNVVCGDPDAGHLERGAYYAGMAEVVEFTRTVGARFAGAGISSHAIRPGTLGSPGTSAIATAAVCLASGVQDPAVMAELVVDGAFLAA